MKKTILLMALLVALLSLAACAPATAEEGAGGTALAETSESQVLVYASPL